MHRASPRGQRLDECEWKPAARCRITRGSNSNTPASAGKPERPYLTGRVLLMEGSVSSFCGPQLRASRSCGPQKELTEPGSVPSIRRNRQRNHQPSAPDAQTDSRLEVALLGSVFAARLRWLPRHRTRL